MKKLSLLALAAVMLFSSCFHDGALLYNPTPLMQYQHKPTEARLLELAKSYADAINKNLEDKAMHPGLYADYGVALANLGCKQQANVMFNNEMMLFPMSSRYVEVLRQTLVPELSAVTTCDTSVIDLKTLDTIPITYTPEEEALRQQIANDPEYKRMQKQLQKEEKEQKALEAKKAKKLKAKENKEKAKAKEKSKKEAQKAKAKAQKEREKAKKEALKEKQKAAKEAEKAKKAEAKAKKEAQKEAEKAKQESSSANN